MIGLSYSSNCRSKSRLFISALRVSFRHATEHVSGGQGDDNTQDSIDLSTNFVFLGGFRRALSRSMYPIFVETVQQVILADKLIRPQTFSR